MSEPCCDYRDHGCGTCACPDHSYSRLHPLGADDLQCAMDLLKAQPYQPTERLVSPRCGLRDEHSECRSAICQCECHIKEAL